jgi:hypothetical protein
MDPTRPGVGQVTDTATDAAKDVAQVAKDEGASVVREAKVQLQDLYVQARDEVGDQAAKQQDRLAQGLRSFSDELRSMARNGDGSTMAADLVRSTSDRAAAAATWIGDRDPAGVLDEVKRFARRRPGMFITVAAVAGVLVGRLTRALAQGAAETAQRTQTGASTAPGVSGRTGDVPMGSGVRTPGAAGFDAMPATDRLPATDRGEAPVYSEAATRFADEHPEGTHVADTEGTHERRDTL